MINQVFKTKASVIFLFLWVVCFHRLTIIPNFLVPNGDTVLLFFVLFLLLLYCISEKNVRIQSTLFTKLLNKVVFIVIISAIINCLICDYYRNQDYFETLRHWSPIFLLFFYYPFRNFYFSIKDWEKNLFILFLIVVAVDAIMVIFPESLLFEMTSGNEKFEDEHRVRIYGDGALVLGNLLCFNKAFTDKNKLKYWSLFIISALLIFLQGYRMVIATCLVVYFYCMMKLKVLKIQYGIIGILLIYVLSLLPIVQERVDEIIERNETSTYNNDDYVQVLVFAYYYTDYFKSNYELFFGSGMVQRIVKKSSTEMGDDSEYKSKYSKDVSYMSYKYHFYPVDWGMIGLSWEAGIPVVLALLTLIIFIFIKKTPKYYCYISSWFLFLLLSCLSKAILYIHHNLIFFAMGLVMFEKIVYIENKPICSNKYFQQSNFDKVIN